jgi:hypothetical protein
MEEKVKLLEEWKKRIRNAQKAHYKDAEKLKRNKMLLGLPTVILTTVVGTSVFASINQSSDYDNTYYPIVVGILSITAAILASLQTFLNYSEKSEKHLNAARKLSSLKKEVQQNLITLEKSDEVYNEFILYVRTKWDEIINEAPLISKSNFMNFFEKKKNKKPN